MVSELFSWAAAAAGAAVALYGAWILITGRATERALRAFRSAHRAGLYALLTGTGLVLLALGTLFDQIILLCLALLLCGVAFVKFLPRGRAGG